MTSMGSIYSMPLRELQQVVEHASKQTRDVRSRYNSMSTALTRYKESLESVVRLKKAKEEQVIVEIGTGFFVKKHVDYAEEYIKRRIKSLEKLMDSVGESLLALENNQIQVENVFKQRVMLTRKQMDENDQRAAAS